MELWEKVKEYKDRGKIISLPSMQICCCQAKK